MQVTNFTQPLKDVTCLFYIRSQRAPYSKHSPPPLYNTNLLMLCKAKVAVCSEIRTQQIKAMCALCRSVEC